jgi:gliding motility-associated-like protein
MYRVLKYLLFLSSFCLGAQPLFIPNVGQWKESFVAKMDLRFGAYFYEENGYRAIIYNPEELPSHDNHSPKKAVSQVEAHSFSCEYVGSNKHPKFQGIQESGVKRNYFLGSDPTRWKSGVPEYSGFQLKNIYDNIDYEIKNENGSAKSLWHIHPDGNPLDIKMIFKGLSPKINKEGQLVLMTEFGEIIETAPVAYSLPKMKRIKCSFQIDGDIVSFKLGRYNKQQSIVIDPTLVFASFSGSTSDNWGYTATYDDFGNLYGGGIVFNPGYPTTLGVLDPTYNSGTSGGGNYANMDIGLTKFSSNGVQRIYSTYIGGGLPDQAQSMIVNNAGELLIFGTTGSSDFPINGMTIAGYDKTFNGGPSYGPGSGSNLPFEFNAGIDTYVLKLNSTGTAITGGSFVGSTSNEGLNLSLAKNYGDQARGEIVVDQNDNIFVITTSGASSFPGAGSSGGQSDAVIFSMSPNLQNLRWSRFLGGSGKEAGSGIKVANNGKIYVTGATTSTNFPNTTGGKYPNYMGSMDGFITRLSASGVIEQSTYLGTNQNDQSFFIDIDKYGGIYVFGQTFGLWPVKPSSVWSTPSGGQFIQKYNSNLSNTIFSTKFGTANNSINIVPTAFNVDECLNILMSGWGGETNAGSSGAGGSTNGLFTTTDAIQKTTDGNDFYFLVMERNASAVLYASFYGGSGNEHVDGGTSRFAPDGTIYQAVCAACSNGSFPTTPGVVSPTNLSPNCNLGVIKIDFETSVTADASIDYEADVDTICDNLRVSFTNNSLNANQFFWDFGNGQTSTGKEPTVIFTKGTYTIKLVATDTVCDISDSTSLTINHDQGLFPTADYSTEYFSCDREFKVTFLNESDGSQKHEWRFIDGSIQFGDTVDFYFSKPGTFETQLIAYDTTCGTSDTIFKTVTFDPDWPGPEVSVSPDSCKDGRIRVNVEYGTDTSSYIYKWTFENGITDTGRVATYRLPSSGTYSVHLDLIDTICNAVYGYDFTSTILRLDQRLYIPSAFTPNGDGTNEELKIGGNDCFLNDRFVILNSIGNVVFETSEPFKEFWDGKIDGKPAQQDTYVYRFETEDGWIYGYVSLIY